MAIADFSKHSFNESTKKSVDHWLHGGFDQTTKAIVLQLLEEDPQEAINAFYKHLEFGTGGMRGLMGVGINRMNVYTIRGATQGICDHLKSLPFENQDVRSAVIAYDSRHLSKEFACEAAKVFAANGLQVYLCKELRPTPLLSFACRQLKCSIGVMITASHNPPEYNGFKVYWDDGGQVLPPHDQKIINQVQAVKDLTAIKTVSIENPLIHWIGDEIDKKYIEAVRPYSFCLKENKNHGGKLKVVFSALHGTGTTLVPVILKDWGFVNFSEVEMQKAPDGSFPTVAKPNPEEKSALKLGIEQMEKEKGDLLIATDPDADRVGVAVIHENKTHLLTGNQIFSLCVSHVCQCLASGNHSFSSPAFVKTIVTTELFRKIVEKHSYACFDVLTGFKYIAELMQQWEEKGPHQFVFGGEESYGYLLGSHAHDKDAVISSALICEIALQAKLKGKTLINLLHDLYREYGIYREQLVSMQFPETQEGHASMKKAMASLRKGSPKKISGLSVTLLEDYNQRCYWNFEKKTEGKISFPQSNVLRFFLENGSVLCVRPSGTEPKIKLYASVCGNIGVDLQQSIQLIDDQCVELLSAVKNLLSSSTVS